MADSAQTTREIAGVRVPAFLYGTAWKEDATKDLTSLALEQGFRGIDTANQRRHYCEAAVGEAVTEALAKGLVRRDELFLQTKFAFKAGQDQRLPYDPNAPVSTQVRQSFASSLVQLRVETIDSYLLHGPSQRAGLAADDWEAWQAMETLHDSGQARLLGVSNVSLQQLQAICRESRVPPRLVQNRCYASQGWDRPVRQFCSANGIGYQGFSLLTANRDVLGNKAMAQIATRHGRSPSQIIFRFALDVGMIPLTGTTSAAHMQEDLAVFDFRLTPDEIRQIEEIGVT